MKPSETATNIARELAMDSVHIPIIATVVQKYLWWTDEDPRMLREQIRVADAAYNRLLERHNLMERALNNANAIIGQQAEENERTIARILGKTI